MRAVPPSVLPLLLPLSDKLARWQGLGCLLMKAGLGFCALGQGMCAALSAA